MSEQGTLDTQAEKDLWKWYQVWVVIELVEVLVCSQSYDVIGISKTWWNESHDWSAGMKSCGIFKRDRQSRWGGEVAPYVRERIDCTVLTDKEDVVVSIWLSIRGMENKADDIVGVYYQSPSQDDSIDELFYR